MPDPLLTVQDIARRYRKTTRTVHHWCRRRWIPFLTTPGGKRFDPERLAAWERTWTTEAQGVPPGCSADHGREHSGRPA